MKKNTWHKSLFLFLLALTINHCRTSPTLEPTEAPAPTDSASMPANPIDTLLFLSSTASSNPDSRLNQMTLTVTDEQGNPVPGVPLSIVQEDLDFFFDSSYNPNAAWTEVVGDQFDWANETDDAEMRRQQYAAVGFNTDLVYAAAWWPDIEPADDDWQEVVSLLSDQPPDSLSNPRLNPFLPGTRFFRVNLGPVFMGSNNPYLHPSRWIPEWVDDSTEESFKAEFGEFISEVIRRGLITIDGYDLYEIGIEINNWDRLPWQVDDGSIPRSEATVQEWVELLAWEIDLVNELDPDAFICLHLDHMGWEPENYPLNLGPQPIIEGLVALEADFDCIGFEIHPGSYPGEYDTVDFWRRFLDEMETYGKPIYVWEYLVRSSGPADPAPAFYPSWEPPVDTYDEAYQERVFMDIFEMFIQDPQVIGVALLDYADLPEALVARHLQDHGFVFQSGLLRSDKSPKPLYDSLMEYWHSLMVTFEAETDANGQVTFEAIPGLFELSVNGQEVNLHLSSSASIRDMAIGEWAVQTAVPEQAGDEDSGETITPCQVETTQVGELLSVRGQIDFIDTNDPGGLFIEISDGADCRLGTWTMIQEWSSWGNDLQSQVIQGAQVEFHGRLTSFDGELILEVDAPAVIH